MNIPKSIRAWHTILWLPAFLLLLLAFNPATAANYPLEIIQPQPNLNTLNRFYKAYPGLEYNVRMAVAGGAYPYRYELLSGPSGMSIDGRGEITWANPTEASSPHSVSVRVTDSEGKTQSVNWTITVTTSGFLFVDAVNGTPASQGGTGTRSNPWKSMKDVYGGDDYNSKHSDHHPGAFVYWRAGTYGIDAYIEDCPGECRVPWTGRRPLVWLAYPGETPQINFNLPGHKDAFIQFYTGISNLYIDGFDFNNNGNTRGKTIAVSQSGNTVFRRNIFRNLTNGWTGGNNSHLFYTGSGGEYNAIQDNVTYGNAQVNGYWLLGYVSPKTLVENNDVSTIGAHPIGPKSGVTKWTIRGNYLHNNSLNSINIMYGGSYGTPGDYEVCYNLVVAGGGRVVINDQSYKASGFPVYVYRNTFMDEVLVKWVTSTNGPFEIRDNVIVNETSHPDKIQRTSIEDPSRLIISDNLTGSRSDNIVDDEGNLTSNYSSYVGSQGHQIGHQLAPPKEVRLVTR
jgi:hypothetical protein